MSDHESSPVREEAFRAAAAAVDRFLGRIGDGSGAQIGEVGAAARERLRAEMGRVVDLNLEVVRTAFGLYGGLLEPENLLSPREDLLDIGPTIPGEAPAAVLWLHNFEDDPIGELELVGSRLLAATSGDHCAPGWSFSPSTITVPPRSAVPVLVTIDVPEDTHAGSYIGTVTPRGHEADPIEVRLEVVALDPVPHASW